MVMSRGTLKPYPTPKKVRVGCYSGYKANERPLWFEVGDVRREVVSVVDRWYGQEHDFFKVSAEDGKIYMLRWHRQLDRWELLSEGERLGYH